MFSNYQKSFKIREILSVLLAVLLLVGNAAAERSVQEIEAMLELACYINPDGGTMVHTIPDCRIVHPQYIPMTKVDYTDEIQANYSFCPVCCLNDYSEQEEAVPEQNGPEGEDFFAQFEGMEWSFCSGAGAWSTDLRILPDGSFSGEYHDSEMGDYAEEYLNGTVYICPFSGKMTLIGQADDNTWRIRVESLKEVERQEDEYIDDGIRYIYTTPYGISEGDEMIMYRPGTPLAGFTEEMMMWIQLYNDSESIPSELKNWFMYSDKNESGFVGFRYENGI